MPSTHTCPPDAVLAAVASGGVQEPLLDWYAEHLEACDACSDRVAGMSLPKQWLPDAVRGSSIASQAEAEPDDVAALLQSLKAMAPPWQGDLADERAAGLPATIGLFRVDRQIGCGATAVVYEAFDAQLDRRVILKVLRPTMAPDASTRDLFMQEARTLAALNHPHVMPLYQVLWNGDEPVLVFPSLSGRTLEEAIAAGLGDWRRAAGIVRDVADALAFAHSKGIVHRDVKPSNIWLQRNADGTEKPLLFDFGLAGMASPATGTPGYRPPLGAVAAGDGQAADTFSLAVVLFEATRALAETPPRVRAATSRLLGAGPDSRPTAADVRLQMHRLTDDALGRRAWLGGVAAVSATALAAAVVMPSWRRPSEPRGPALPEPVMTFRGRANAPFAVSEDGGSFCLLDDRGTLVVGQRGAAPVAAVPGVPFAVGRLAIRNRTCGGLVAAAGDGKVVVLDPQAGTILATYDAEAAVSGIAWSGTADGTLLVLAAGTLFTASQRADASFPETLTAARLWRGWNAGTDAVAAMASVSSYEYVAAVLTNLTVATWSLDEAHTRGLFHLEPPRLGAPAVPLLVGWRSLDAFYVVNGRRVTSCHVLPRMTEEIDLPAAVSSLVWLDGDVLAFVASAGPHAGRLGCIVQSSPATVVWVSREGQRMSRVDAVQNRRTLVAGCDDGRVLLYDSADLRTAARAGRTAGRRPAS